MTSNHLPPEHANPTRSDLQALLWLGDQIPGGFFIYRADDSQEILYVNRAMLRIFGCDTEEEFRKLTGNTFRGLVHPEDFDKIQSSIDRQISDSANENLDHVEYRIIRGDGEVRWVDDYGHFATVPGYGDVYFVFLTDITEQRLIRETALRMELELGQEKRENKIKSDFLFNLSHDIRTPMNAIIGFVDLAKRHIREPDLLEDYLDKVSTSSHQLLSLIDDMLEMNRISSGRLELNPEITDLRRQIRAVLDLFHLPMEQKRLTLKTDLDLPPDEVMVDVNCFRRILGNLMSNAVKFTPEGGTITVSARRKQVSESGFARYEFSVADTGVGIAEDFLPRVFDTFERENTSTMTGVEGSGLGLSIVKGLLDAMGGSVSVSSAKGEGSVFTVELALSLASRAEFGKSHARQEPSEKKEAGNYRILLVEDMEINRILAETVLRESGFQVESVTDGCDAVEAVKRHPAGYYDLVLMDIQMPVMNGYEATKAIRALHQDDAKTLPIIALSANARDDDRRMSLGSGMDDHIAKPFDISHLIRAIHDHISDHS